MPSVYVHIPFCQSRCIYCDFYSTTSLSLQERYVDALLKEMEGRKGEWPQRARTLSIYIGGGTPSTLPPYLLQRLLEHIIALFPIEKDAEITVEANPDDVSDAWIDALRHSCVNRVSMGVQTFDDALLHTLRRRHSAQQARDAVARLQAAGFRNLSVDLIYGLPGQTLPSWERDIDEALRLGVPHLSAYSLMYEEGTPITHMLEAGLIDEMPDECSLQCFQWLRSKLLAAGYEQYEISNFALPGWHSRHNSGYWQGTPYLGFGAGAHSYDGQNTRRANLSDLHTYLDSPLTACQLELLSPTDRYNEYIMTRLRTAAGFSLAELTHCFGTHLRNHSIAAMRPHLEQGNLVCQDEVVRLTPKGIFVSNEVMSDLFA
ncbi:MAG: radical SAM family heme chaperone HemW [Bacteroidales bacterium]|nr:radical SAM family heme chaperone HemW [Candidatus Physcousia equi]